jgi:hypothetical protein
LFPSCEVKDLKKNELFNGNFDGDQILRLIV